MANKGKISMLSLFELVPISKLKLLTPIDQLKDILLSEPLKPENLTDSDIDPNTCLITKHHEHKKKVVKEIKRDSREDKDQKAKVYKKGPFAEFYQQNEEEFDKDAEAWYYKEGKQIIGPVSSYNMDKMVYHKTITGETRVAFKTVDKFVKFSKIQKVLEEARGQHQDEEHETHESSHHEKHQSHHHKEGHKVHKEGSKEEVHKDTHKSEPKSSEHIESPKKTVAATVSEHKQ